MSFSCPHFDYDRDGCWRLGKPCVPGRPGCVLRSNSAFRTPVEERLEEESQRPRPRRVAEGKRTIERRGPHAGPSTSDE